MNGLTFQFWKVSHLTKILNTLLQDEIVVSK